MSKTIEHFFKPVGSNDSSSSKAVHAAAVLAAQKEMEKIAKAGQKRGAYAIISEELKAKVGKYAAENGVTVSLRHFKTSHELDLKESTVRGWVTAYQKKLESLRKEGKELTVSMLSEKPRGRPLLLGSELEDQVKSFVREVRSSGGVVNSAIVKAAAKGIILAKDANLLQENGGGINLTKDWANRLLARMGYVKRKATTKAKVSPAHFDSLKAQFLSDIRTIVVMESIPPELIINWDQTGIKYVPVSCWTLEKKGSKRVEIAGVDDKHQITALLAGTLAGQVLPAQLIYARETPVCMPKTRFPSDWHVTFTPTTGRMKTPC